MLVCNFSYLCFLVYNQLQSGCQVIIYVGQLFRMDLYLKDEFAKLLWESCGEMRVGVYKITRSFSSTMVLSDLKLDYKEVKRTKIKHV